MGVLWRDCGRGLVCSRNYLDEDLVRVVYQQTIG